MKRFLTVAVAAVTAMGFGIFSVPSAGAGGDKCPLKALDNADKPVEITYWHSMSSTNGEVLAGLTDAFNSSQGDVHVNLVNQTSYDDTVEKFRNALATGEIPDVAQLPE